MRRDIRPQNREQIVVRLAMMNDDWFAERARQRELRDECLPLLRWRCVLAVVIEPRLAHRDGLRVLVQPHKRGHNRVVPICGIVRVEAEAGEDPGCASASASVVGHVAGL